MTENLSNTSVQSAGEERSPFEPAQPSTPRTVRKWIFVALVIGAAILAAWWFTRPTEGAEAAAAASSAVDSLGNPVMLSPDAEKHIGVTYAVVERGSLGAEVRTVGLVTYDEARVKTIAPKIDGWVEQLLVATTGESVGQGDPLLRIYSPMLVTAQEELLLAKKLSSELANGNADAVRNAETLLTSARRRLKYWDIADDEIARVERTGEAQKTIILRSPVRGVVVQKNVSSGQRIMAGDALYQVADLREVWLEGEVFERDLSAVRIGETVTAEFSTAPGQLRHGRIVFVSPIVSLETRTTKVRVALPNADLALKPGMYATIRISGQARQNVLSIPRSAVLVTGQRVLVFVKGADGVLTPREVELGGNTDERVEILRGVAAGEQVVSSATFLVDAESNLGSALGAMANMPGMDVKSAAPPKSAPALPATKQPAPDPMASMPGMAMPPKKP